MNVGIYTELTCAKCGDTLEVARTTHGVLTIGIVVRPCSKCTRAATEQARIEGHEAGRADGVRERKLA